MTDCDCCFTSANGLFTSGTGTGGIDIISSNILYDYSSNNSNDNYLYSSNNSNFLYDYSSNNSNFLYNYLSQNSNDALNTSNQLIKWINSNSDGVYFNDNPNNTRIDSNGIINVYHTSNFLLPADFSTWWNVEDKLTSNIIEMNLTKFEVSLLTSAINGLTTLISTINGLIASLEASDVALTVSMALVESQIQTINAILDDLAKGLNYVAPLEIVDKTVKINYNTEQFNLIDDNSLNIRSITQSIPANRLSYTNAILNQINDSTAYLKYIEDGTITFPVSTIVDFLVVGAGGRGGAGYYSGGGGGGEVIYKTSHTFASGTYSITIGKDSDNPTTRITKIHQGATNQVIAKGGGDGGFFDTINSSIFNYYVYKTVTARVNDTNNYILNEGGHSLIFANGNIAVNASIDTSYPLIYTNVGAIRTPYVWYKFDTASYSFDSGTKATNFTNVGSVNDTTIYLRGNGSASFNGSSQYINTSMNVSLGAMQISLGLSFSFWVYLKPTTNTSSHIFNFDNGTGPSRTTYMTFGKYTDGLTTGLLFQAIGTGTTINLKTNNAINYFNNKWYYITITFTTSGDIKLYINNSLINTSTGNIPNIAWTNTYLGGGLTDNYFNGNIDDFRIYQKELSTFEINDLYNGFIVIDDSPTSGGSGGGGTGGDFYARQSGANSGSVWNASYSTVANGSTGTLTEGGSGGGTGYAEVITGNDLLVGKGGLGNGDTNYFPNTKNDFGEGGDGLGGLGYQGVVIIKAPYEAPQTTFSGYTNWNKVNSVSVVTPLAVGVNNQLSLTYDSSLTKVGNNLSVVKTATNPLKWTGNDISLDYDNTLLLTSGTLGVNIGAESKWLFTGGNIYNKSLTNVGIGTLSGITSRLTVQGDIYTSSNINCGIRPLTFISSFTNSTLTAVTGNDEFYLQYTANGTLVLNEPCGCDLLVVGAGGDGGIGSSSGGGGAGEVIYFPNFPLRSGTLNVNVGIQSSTPANRNSSITHSSGTQIIAKGGGNGGTFNFYTTSGGTVSALTAIAGTNDAYISITGTTTLTLNKSATIDLFMIGGGGGGGKTHAGGGGAGAYYYNTSLNFNSGTYTITIGSGGSGATNNSDNGTNGGNTLISSGGTNLYLVNGGGRGGGSDGTGGSGTTSRSGKNGGCGGGGGSYNGGSTPTNTAIPAGSASNSGTNGTGNNGGTGCANQSGGVLSGGGGGGANSAGGNAPNSQTGNGGNGGDALLVNIKGIEEAYGGGGGGGVWGDAYSTTGGLGGGATVNGVFTRVGGQGGTTGPANNQGANAVANTGSGGGGGGPYEGNGGNGSAGIVIIRFKNYLTLVNPTSGGSGGGGAKTQIGAVAGVKFDDYKSFALAGLNGTSTNGGNGGSGNTTYNTRYTSTITGSSLSVGLGGSGVGATPATPTVKSNYGDGGDANGGVGFQGIIIIRFKNQNTNLHVKAIKDNANTGLILNANESPTSYQLRVYPWSDTYQLTGIATRGWSFRCHDGNNNLDLLNLFSSFGGRIGIKTKNPTATFDVNGDIACKTFSVVGNEFYGITCQIVNQHNTGEANLTISAGASGNYGSCGLSYLPIENQGLISCTKSLKIKTGNDADNSFIYIDNTNGRVGIGNNVPQAKLDVNGTILASAISVLTVNSDAVATGNISCTSMDLNNGSIINVNKLASVEIETGPIKCGAINLQGSGITNGATIQGTCTQARFLVANVNEWHYSQDNRNRFYFTDDTTTPTESHTVFRTGSNTHYFQNRDGVDYCLLDRFGISTYFEVISGGGYDAVSVLDASVTGVYVYRRMLVKLNSFSEVHRCFCEDELYIDYDQFINEFIGRIVVSKGKIKTALKEVDKDWEILEGKDGITIDDSHAVVELSRKKKDKAVVGIITKRNQNNDLSGRLVINSLGETGIWIVNTGGDIENGDLITTSNEIGYGEKQDCDFIKNYTIGKCMIDCSFELDSPNYKCEVIDESRDLRRAFLPIFIYSG